MSETMIPTMRLRFVLRWVPDPKNSHYRVQVRILQQTFTIAETGKTVWQDVPLETEEQQ
jgi:hypothetical protein